jgi:hypothetical protein
LARLTPSKSAGLAETAYAVLLWLYPSAYNTRYNTEMRQTFRDLYRDSPRHAAGFWGPLIADSLSGAAREHLFEIRNNGMKQYFTNSADGRTLAWGAGLMVPSGLFFVIAALGLLHPSQLGLLHNLPALPLMIAVLPIVAIVINVIALGRAIARTKQPVINLKFFERYFWTIAVIAAALGWLALLFGHDTAGCALNYLPGLDWNGFQHCAATH